MLKQLALLGRGIIVGPEYLVDKEIQAGTLQAILTTETMNASTAYLIHPQLVQQSARLSSFIHFTLNWFQQLNAQ